MKLHLMLPVIAALTLLSCNNSAKKDETTKDTGTQTTVTHDGMTMPSNMPDLPAVPEGAKVYFKNLKDNQTISSPFKIEMGCDVIRIDTAGPVVAGTGHHHLFIDAEDSLTAGTIVPKDSAHVHFGKGQTEYEVKLSPGKHKLTLQMADGLHRSYGSKLATTVSVNVK
jgi:hypothetical protein